MSEEPEWILVGMVKRLHGRNGELLIRQLTDREDRFQPGSQLYLSPKKEDIRIPVRVEAARMSDRGPLVKLEGYDSREAVWDLFGASLFISASELGQPEKDRYYAFQLEGCDVFEDGRLVGKVVALHESRKANPYLEIEPAEGGQHIYIPFVSQVAISIDVQRKRIEIAPGFLHEG